ncbi:hypothetical protein D3C81_1134230 [compost metagenome]
MQPEVGGAELDAEAGEQRRDQRIQGGAQGGEQRAEVDVQWQRRAQQFRLYLQGKHLGEDATDRIGRTDLLMAARRQRNVLAGRGAHLRVIDDHEVEQRNQQRRGRADLHLATRTLVGQACSQHAGCHAQRRAPIGGGGCASQARQVGFRLRNGDMQRDIQLNAKQRT